MNGLSWHTSVFCDKVITLHKFINLKHYYYLIMLNNQRKVSKSIYLVYFTSQDILHIYKTIIFHYQYFIKMDANKCKGIFIYLFIWNILHGNIFYMDYGKLITCKIHFTRPTFRQVWEKITEALRVREREFSSYPEKRTFCYCSGLKCAWGNIFFRFKWPLGRHITRRKPKPICSFNSFRGCGLSGHNCCSCSRATRLGNGILCRPRCSCHKNDVLLAA